MEMINFVDYENSAEAFKVELTKRWQRGRVTNFEYLMHLNTLAGRSFNDLTQYPVFPFILSKYKKSRELNVNDPNNYRNLNKPMGAQTEDRLQKFIEKYNALIEMVCTSLLLIVVLTICRENHRSYMGLTILTLVLYSTFWFALSHSVDILSSSKEENSMCLVMIRFLNSLHSLIYI